MLMKCPECTHEVSSAAAACQNCGHPIQLLSVPSAPAMAKVSHGAGWISLAAVILGVFSPAILAPIFVLVALVFAGKQFSAGGRKFGALVLCLALLQGWFVLDHFGNISSSLGIKTAEDADADAVARYAGVSLSLPGDWRSLVQMKCSEEWPNDLRMQAHCVEKQTEAAQLLGKGAPSGVDQGAFRVIRGKCAEEWPRDFSMRAHCERQQLDAYRTLSSSRPSAPIRNTCAQQWPNDYKMRQYCESKGG